MALGKTIKDNRTLLDCTYWRVIEVNINYYSGVGRISIAGYIDEKNRRNGGRPLMTMNYKVGSDDFSVKTLNPLNQNPIKVAYEFIKAIKKQSTNESGDPIETPGEFAAAKDI